MQVKTTPLHFDGKLWQVSRAQHNDQEPFKLVDGEENVLTENTTQWP